MNHTKPSIRLNAQVREEAVEWFTTFCEGDIDVNAREQFMTWLRASPEHVRAYLRISAFWQEAGSFNNARKRDVDTLVQLALSESNVVPIAQHESARLPLHPAARTQREHRLPRWGRRFAVAASLLLLGCLSGGMLAWYQFYRAPTYATEIGERRILTLPDGSTVELNARSRIAVQYSEKVRIVDLREGQALFRVASNPARPFIVRSDVASIRAVGTQFDVYRKGGATIVTVVEGRVAVANAANAYDSGEAVSNASDSGASRSGDLALLSAGEQVTVTSRAVAPPGHADVLAATSWTTGKLTFDSVPLSEVVREFDRYNERRLIIENPELLGIRISGIFPATDPTRIAQFMHQRFDVVVVETDEEIRLSLR